MKKIKYQLRLKGLSTPSGTISVRALKEVCDLLQEASERGLRLAVEGNSVKAGRFPKWLTDSLDLTITGMEKGSTVLDIEAPALGETAAEHIGQKDFWYVAPEPNDTALTLMTRSVADTTAENLESDTYDAGVLSSLLKFKPFLKNVADRVELKRLDRRTERFAIAEKEIEKIQRLKTRTPEPTAFIVSGTVDVIEHNKKRFHLVLSNGELLLGTIDPEFLSVEDMRRFWGQKATVKGMVHFRPSGKARLIEAHVIKPMENGEEMFAAMPQQQTEADFTRTLSKSAEQRDWLKNIWGKWPGDESIEDLLNALKQN